MKKQKRILKKVISVILALAMIISLVNVPAIGSEAASKKKTVKSVTVTNLPAKTLTLKKNKKFKLKTKVTVTGGASKAVIYKSSKPKVAQVNNKGVITAKKKGKTVITITSKANKSKKYKITVTVGTSATKVSIKASKNYVAAGKTLQLKATVTPKKASNKKVIWSSSNKKVATVTSKGVVKGIKSGTVTITAKAADGSGKKAKFKISVLDTSKWKQAYIDYIEEIGVEALNNAMFCLIKVNDDNIPELLIDYQSTAGGGEVVTFDGTQVNTIHTYSYGVSYIPEKNLICDSGGHMDKYYDYIYKIKNGQFVKCYSGEYGAEDNSHVEFDKDGLPIYRYYWKGVEVEKDEYNELLNAVYDTSNKVRPYDNCFTSYYAIIAAIKAY